ncbi:suppressor APC domain-containing protein 2-like isoform X2 [Haliotis rufescens]|uniref:suppressor APC domain-containing protein 2-like isoform X2 n=1 Tax=Haliotis rufescens TaxID=6454 RepID=UPI001EAFD5FC|nr:suppressor APC domain-containing protein 2-like isoform X2 [Haliotis rufescens]
MSVSDNTETIDGLPKQFISSLRILFEILDENRSGYVRLCDIESRWSENGVKGLPTGVVEALRKVTPSDGLLSFSKFVAGLRLALLKHKPVTSLSGKENRGPGHHIPRGDAPRGRGDAPPRGHSQPPPQITRSYPPQAPPATAAVKPNNAANTNFRRGYGHPSHSENIYSSAHELYRVPQRPDRPTQYRKSTDLAPPDVPPREKSKGGRVLNELKNWQRERSSAEPRDPRLQTNTDKLAPTNSRVDQYAIYANIEQFQRKNAEESGKSSVHPSVQSSSALPSNTAEAPQKPVRRQNSARRHTLSSGLDYNAIKRMKQFEEERDMLLQGLEAVDTAREWYRKQISAIQDKQKYLGKAAFNEHSLEAHQERMNFQKARIVEVNQQLRTLTDSSEKGFPLHMNLAMGPTANLRMNNSSVKMLKDQNRQLTKEVSQKSDKITQLEQEKSTLIRELFESRSKHKTNYDDTTFM